MPQEHVIFSPQTAAWTTWVTPAKAIYMDSFSLDPGVARVERRLTGLGRGLKHSWLGPKLVTGSFEMPAWYEYLGYFFKAAGLHDIASVVQGATAAYLHGFLPKDDTVPYGLSVQLKRDADDADNVLGLLINSLTLTATAGEPLVLRADFIAYDEAPTGSNWEGGTAAPAVIATPAYFADTILPFRFQHGTLNQGATLTFDDTGNKYTKADGAAVVVESFELTIENGWDPRIFLGSRLPGNVVGQARSITGRFDVDQSTVDETFRGFYRDGTRKALWLEFDSGVEAATGYDYTLRAVVPNVDFVQGALPDLGGSQDRRMQGIEFTGLMDDNEYDINLQLIDLQAAY